MFCYFINPRRACAARVTVLGLRVSWGAIFSVRGGEEKGERKEGVNGQSGEENINAMKKEKGTYESCG